jgi:hypothetical protein
MSHVRNSAQYWAKVRSNLYAYDENFGPATFFFTLSPAEYNWSELHEFLKRMNKDLPNIDSLTFNQLMDLDPVCVSMFFEKKFRAFFSNFILGKNGTFDKVKYYFWRREYQTRGAPHIHGKLWIDGAPIFGQDPPEKIIEFIDNHITCRLPDPVLEPKLYDLVMRMRPNFVKNIRVKFDKIAEPVNISRVTNDYESKNHFYVTRAQFPLTLAWALTIHKCQGLSLDAVLLDIGSDIFEPGQAYVALSRGRKLDKVFLIEFGPKKLMCNELCIKAYNDMYIKCNKPEKVINIFNLLPTAYANPKKPTRVRVPKLTINELSATNFTPKKNYTRKTSRVNKADQENSSRANSDTRTESILLNSNLEEQFQFHLNRTFQFRFRNYGENFCYANASIQCLLALGCDFFSCVIK